MSTDSTPKDEVKDQVKCCCTIHVEWSLCGIVIAPKGRELKLGTQEGLTIGPFKV